MHALLQAVDKVASEKHGGKESCEREPSGFSFTFQSQHIGEIVDFPNMFERGEKLFRHAQGAHAMHALLFVYACREKQLCCAEKALSDSGKMTSLKDGKTPVFSIFLFTKK